MSSSPSSSPSSVGSRTSAPPADAADAGRAPPAAEPTPPGPPAPSAPSTLALGLGYAGLLPFAAGAALVWLVQGEAQAFAGQALSAYAALIASFLGGIHWGLALRRETPPPALLVWGVVPSLLAWPAVMMPPASGLVLAGAVLLLCWAVDRRLYRAHGVAQWLTLRFRLSAVAALACFLGAAGS